jgi:hypothetical protein
VQEVGHAWGFCRGVSPGRVTTWKIVKRREVDVGGFL